MNRRTFLRIGAASAGAGLAAGSAPAFVPAHRWDGYDWGTAPRVPDRLNQGPFPQYPPEEVLPGSEVVMATTPSREIVPGYGMGLVTYVTGDYGAETFRGVDARKAIEELVRIPIGQKLYVRPTWREIQKRPGRLEPEEYWKTTLALARQYGKRVGFRVMMSSPDIRGPSLPDFVLERVPMVRLKGEWKRRGREAESAPAYYEEPRYDDPFFQAAFRELNGLLAAELDGGDLVECVDTFMYGFWGEGHTWPFTNHPFPDDATAERTFVRMFDTQLEHWKKTPLVTNTQPDFSRVGNSELVDRTIRSHNWLRSDTIFIENEQIEALGNRPPWVAAILEASMAEGTSETAAPDDGVTPTENVIAHVMDLGVNYWSLWNWHAEKAENVLRSYRNNAEAVDAIARRIGYRVRPSWIWSYDGNGQTGIVVGLTNDGISGVPGVLRLTLRDAAGNVLVSGCVDPGCPVPGRVRQARLPLPAGTPWEGLRLSAEIHVKDARHPVRWACRQRLEPDGSLRLRRTPGVG
jgi:hypothetical protein